MRNIESLKKMFDNADDVLFVDNEEIFQYAVKNAKYEDYFSDIFAGDFGHCTAKGNRILAENIAKVISKNIFKTNL